MKVTVGNITIEFEEKEQAFAIKLLLALTGEEKPKARKTTRRKTKSRISLTEQEQEVFDVMNALKDESNIVQRVNMLSHYRENTPNDIGWVSSLKRIEQKGYAVRLQRGVYQVVA